MQEYTITELQQKMNTGELTSRQLAQLYLERIDSIDRNGPRLNAIIETNPDALTLASSLDAERAAGSTRGPLHGIPILLKDNIDTADKMQTTSGSLALEGHHAAQRCGSRGKTARGGRGHPRQDESQRVGQFPRQKLHQRMVFARRADAQSLRAGSLGVRLLVWFGRGGGGESCGGRGRHRDGRLDHLSRADEWDRRHQAHTGTRQPGRHHPDRAQSGYRRSHGAHRHGRGDFAWGDGGSRWTGLRYKVQREARADGLHSVPRRERTAGARASASHGRCSVRISASQRSWSPASRR